jgi:hypothetical protein
MPNETVDKDKPMILQSFKELKIAGAAMNLDLGEDAWSYGAPPPAKELYEVKWFPAKDGYKTSFEKKGDDSSLIISIDLEGRIVNNEEWDDTYVPGQLTSRIYRGRKTSTLVGFLIAGGQKLLLEKYMGQNALTPLKLGEIIEALLKKEPTIRCELDWKGFYSYLDKGGETHWENIRYEDFPLDPSDVSKTKRMHMFTVTGKDGFPHDIRAMLKVNRYLQKGEAWTGGNKGAVASNGARPVMAQPIMVQTVAPAMVQPTMVQLPVAPTVDDEILMLPD